MFIDFRLGLGHSVHRLVTNLEPQPKTRPDSVSYFARMLKAWVILNQVVCNFFHLPQNRASCGVEVWRGGLGGTYRLPTFSVAGASLFPPCFRFHTPLIGRVEG